MGGGRVTGDGSCDLRQVNYRICSNPKVTAVAAATSKQWIIITIVIVTVPVV